MHRTTASNESATLSRELSEFLIEFSIALHKHAIYPEGHPLLASSEAGLAIRLSTLLEERGTLSLGVARQQLVIEGVATDPNNPLLRELAQRLHRHHLGAVKFARGVTDEELADLLRTLAADATRVATPLGLGPPEELRRWEHVRLYSLTFEHLELLDEDDEPERDEAELRDGQRFRAAQLWVGLARAALAAESIGEDGSHAPATADPAIVARAIEEHSRDQAYDQVIVGYLLQIAGELQQGGGAETAVLRRRVSRMVSSLRPETLRQLLEMGGDTQQRQRFVLEAAQGMAVDAVVELVRAAADSSGQTISHSLIRLFNKLAVHAERGPSSMRVGAERALRDNVRRLVEGWELPNPNPGAYQRVLEGMSKHSTAPLRMAVEFDVEPERVVEMSLELGFSGEAVSRAMETLIAAGRVGELVAMLDGAGDAAAREALWAHVASPETLRTLLAEAQLDIPVIERIVARMGISAADPLFEAIESAEERTARWQLLDLLAQLGSEVGPRAVARLEGAEWYVQRNLLVLLGRLPELPEGFSPAVLVGAEADPRVRREALKLQLRTPGMRERALLSALSDADPRIVHLALGAASENCPLPAAPTILAALRGKALDDEMRVLALRALARLRLPNVLEELVRHVEGRRGFFGIGKRSLAPKSPVMLAALGGLAVHWSANHRARSLLALATASSDPEIRAAAAPTPSRR